MQDLGRVRDVLLLDLRGSFGTLIVEVGKNLVLRTLVHGVIFTCVMRSSKNPR